jgi:excisionase family DNA binding protein
MSDTNAAYLTVEEAAEIARVSPATIRSWLNSGRLRGKRFGGRHWRTTREWLDAFGDIDVPQHRPTQAERERRSAAALARIEQMFGSKRKKR